MRRALLLALLLSNSCFPRLSIPQEERHRAAAEFADRKAWLRVAVFVSPLFSDRTKALLYDQPRTELDMLETPAGEPILPPEPEKILPPGSPVYINSIEFPTGWTVAKRVVLTPRYHPWVILEVPGDERPYVVVLSMTVEHAEHVRSELERVLSFDDPSPTFRALPPTQQGAIQKKQPSEGMGPQALAMAWGYPDKKQIDRPEGTEEWIWSGGKRRAFFSNDRLVRWEPR